MNQSRQNTMATTPKNSGSAIDALSASVRVPPPQKTDVSTLSQAPLSNPPVIAQPPPIEELRATDIRHRRSTTRAITSDPSTLPGKSVLVARGRGRRAEMNKDNVLDRASLRAKIIIIVIALCKIGILGMLAVQCMEVRVGKLGNLRKWASHILQLANVDDTTHNTIVNTLLLTPSQHTVSILGMLLAAIGIAMQMGVLVWALEKRTPLMQIIYVICGIDVGILAWSITLGAMLLSEYQSVASYVREFTIITQRFQPVLNNSVLSSPEHAMMNGVVAAILFTIDRGVRRKGTHPDDQAMRANHTQETFIGLQRMFKCCGLLKSADWIDSHQINLTTGMQEALEKHDLHLDAVAAHTKDWFCACYQKTGWPCIVPWTCCQLQHRGKCTKTRHNVELRHNKGWCSKPQLKDECECQKNHDCYQMNQATGVTKEHILHEADAYCGLEDKYSSIVNESALSGRRSRFPVALTKGAKKKIDGKETHHVSGCLLKTIQVLLSYTLQMTIMLLMVVPALTIVGLIVVGFYIRRIVVAELLDSYREKMVGQTQADNTDVSGGQEGNAVSVNLHAREPIKKAI